VARLGEAGNRVRSQLGAQRDHQVVGGERLAGNGHHPPLRVDVLNVADANINALSRQARQWAGDRVSRALADHEPQQRRREDVITLAINEHDAVFRRQALPECPCGCDPADAAAQNENGLRVSHGFPSFARTPACDRSTAPNW
jgi:hypothetical protein